MLRKVLLGLPVLLVVALAVAWFTFGRSFYSVYRATSPHTAPQDHAKQDDSRIDIPAQQPGEAKPFNRLKNVYWGDVHVHTEASQDAVLFGTTYTVEDAYRFAKGEKLRSRGGELMQLSRPLDFVAITDHAESFGLRTRCDDLDLSLVEQATCWVLETPNPATFQFVRAFVRGRSQHEPDPTAAPGVYQNRARTGRGRAQAPICSRGQGGPERCERDARAEWASYVELADRYNEPGVLTAFAAYEYSPTLPEAGKHHRNVIFNGSDLPELAISAFDASSALDLWRGLEKTCTGSCDFLTIPHNMNKGWGLFYSRHTWDGRTYDEDDWRLRARREPIAEMYQIKGASECALGVGATDEECAFSQILPPCVRGQETGCAFETSFARQGLKIGLGLDRELGFNPFAFGFVAATDTHNANPGDVEEWDFVGAAGSVSSPAIRRFRQPPDVKPYQTILQFQTSGGIAAVWAEENTRDALFSAMKRREVYATSGPRITLRFFAGWGFDEGVETAPDPVAVATAGGVPMGGVLFPKSDGGVEGRSPTFFVWARADWLSAPLQRVQVVKGWIDSEGDTHERVHDVVCSDGLVVDPNTVRCPDNGASVDLETCAPVGNKGSAELLRAWRDPDFDSAQAAFYYVRALQNPTCRWSTYDAIRLGIDPDPGVPATIRERGWSSPIWIDPKPRS
jgi:hypothetical protein